MLYYEQPDPDDDRGEGPFEPHDRFKQAVAMKLLALDWHRYPRRRQGSIAARIADHFGLEPGMVGLCNGADEALRLAFQWVLLDRKGIQVPNPGPFEYHRIIGLLNIPVTRYDVGEIPPISPVRVPVWCSPNDPTGHVVSATDISNVARQLPGQITGILDLTYDFFADEPLHRDLRGLIDDGVVVCLGLSRAFGLAGARVGVMLGRYDVLPYAMRYQETFAMDWFQLSVLDTFFDPDFADTRDDMIDWVRDARTRLAAGLAELVSPEAIGPLQANFIPVTIESPEAVAHITAATASQLHAFDKLLRVTVNQHSLSGVDRLLAT